MATQTDSAADATLLCRCNEDTLRRLAGAVECNGQIVCAVERVVASPAYGEHVLFYAPQSAGYTPRALGVFLGYDFHLGAQAAGYGSRAAYRGDKLTRRVFEGILEGKYVSQALVAPSARRVEVDAEALDLKVDLRNYVYRGDVQLISARLYRGQTTNLRTPGGGFAPVLTVPCV